MLIGRDMQICNTAWRSIGLKMNRVPLWNGLRKPKANTSNRWAEYAKISLIALGGLTITAGAAGIGGICLQRCGRYLNQTVKMKTTGAALQVLGKHCSKAGRILFLSVTVPLYILFYQLPRWTLTRGIPAVCRKIYVFAQNILNTMDNIIRATLSPITKLAKRLWNHLLLPAYRFATNTLDQFRDLINHGYKLLCGFAVRSLNWLYQSLTLLKMRIDKIVRTTIQYFGKILENPLNRIRPILGHLFEQISRSLRVIKIKIDNIANSALSTIRKTIFWVQQVNKRFVERVILPISQMIKAIATPLWRDIARTSIWLEREIILPVLQKIGLLLQKATTSTLILFRWIGSTVLIPVLKAAAEIVTKTIKGVWKGLQWVFNYTARPLWQSSRYLTQQIIELGRQITKSEWIVHTRQYMWHKFLLPALHKTEYTIAYLGNSFRTVMDKIHDCILAPTAEHIKTIWQNYIQALERASSHAHQLVQSVAIASQEFIRSLENNQLTKLALYDSLS